MKKIFSIVLFLIFFAPSLAHAQHSPLTPEMKNAVSRLAQLQDEKPDYAKTILGIAEPVYADIFGQHYDIQSDLKEIEKLASELRAKIDGEKDPEKIISIINVFLYKEKKFEAAQVLDFSKLGMGRFFLHEMLSSKKGNCYTLSILYLSLAEKVGLPLSGVAVPGHFFVRYETPQKILNIETTENGQIYTSNTEYVYRYAIPETASFYFKNLNRKETFGMALLNWGGIYSQLGDLPKADFFTEASLNLVPGCEMAMKAKALLSLRAKEPDKSLEWSAKALTIYQSPESYGSQGMAYLLKNDPDRAIQSFEQALKLNPKFQLANLALSQAYLAKGEFSSALPYLEKFKRVTKTSDPFSGETLAGEVMGKFNTKTEAVKSIAVLFAKAESLVNQNLYDEAKKDYEKCLSLIRENFGDHYPAQVTVLNNLGDVYLEEGNYQDAQNRYLEALSIEKDYYGKESPRLIIMLDNLAYMHEKLNQPDEAKKYYDWIQEIREKNQKPLPPAVALDDLGRKAADLFEEGKNDEAFEASDDYLKQLEQLRGNDNPDLSAGLSYVGFQYLKQKKPEKAEEFFKRSIEVGDKAGGRDSRLADPLAFLGALYLHSGKLEEAEKLLKRAVDLEQRSAGDKGKLVSILKSLRDIYRQQGREEEVAEIDKQL